MEFKILNRNLEIVATLNDTSNTKGYHFYNASLTEELGTGSELKFDVMAEDDEYSLLQYVKEENYVLFKDKYINDYRLFVMKELTDIHADTQTKEVYSQDISIELGEDIYTDKFTESITIDKALSEIIASSGWVVGKIDKLEEKVLTGIYTNKTVLACINTLADEFNLEVKYTFEVIPDGRIIKKVNLVTRIGNNYGRRFTYEKDTDQLKRIVKTGDLKTAIYPIGKEVKNADGTSSVVTISGIEGTTENCGYDKPVSQSYIEDTEATSIWGIKIGNKLTPRYCVMKFDKAETKEELLALAGSKLKTLSIPVVTYEASVVDLYSLLQDSKLSYTKVMLGDDVGVVDHKFTPSLALYSRVVKIERFLQDETKNKITLGTLLPSLANQDSKKQMEQVASEVASDKLGNIDLSNIWDNINSNKENIGKYPSIKEINQELFNGASGYHSLTKADGLWVYDKPVDQQPRKAVVIKGGQIGIANYNEQLQKWEVGTFIDGLSVNADLINTGTLSADRIEAGSITANHLEVSVKDKIEASIDGTEATKIVNTALKVSEGKINAKIEEVTGTINSVTTEVGASKETIANLDKQIKETTETLTGSVENAEAVAKALAMGKMLYDDPTFIRGSNGISFYNNINNGNVSCSRVQAPEGTPTTSGCVMKVKTVGKASPDNGGFMWNTMGRANAIFVTRIIAKIPYGQSIEFGTNKVGDGYQTTWLTSQWGTGRWEEYIFKLNCGSTGSFEATNYFYLSGTSGTTEAPIVWDIAYATVFDITDSDTRIEDMKQTITTVTQSVASNSSEINVLKDNISAKVSEDTFNQEVTTIKDNLTTVQETVASNKSNIAEVNVGLSGVNSTVSEIQKDTNTIKGGLNDVTHKIEDVTTSVSNLEQTTSGITTSVEEVTGRIDNISYGLKNLINNSKVVASSNAYGYASITGIKLERNKTYTFIAEGYCDQQVLNDNKFLKVYLYPKTWNASCEISTTSLTPEVFYGLFTVPNHLTDDELNDFYVTSYCFPSKLETTGLCHTNWYMILEGTVPSKSWIPSEADTEKELSQTYSTKSEVAQTSDNLRIEFNENGGYNLLHNGRPDIHNTKYWQVMKSNNVEGTLEFCSHNSGENLDGEMFRSGMWFRSNNKGLTTDFWNGIQNNSWLDYGFKFNTNKQYTITFLIYCNRGDGLFSYQISNENSSNLVFESETIQSPNDDYMTITQTFTPKSSGDRPMFMLFNKSNYDMVYSYYIPWVVVAEGTKINTPWSPNAMEVYNGITSIDKDGVTVTHDNSDTYTKLNAEGLQVFDKNTDKSIAHFGQGQTAYIRQLDAEVVNGGNVLPVVWSPMQTINCRVGGSGDRSGRNSDNCVDGVNNALHLATNGKYQTGCILMGAVTIRMHGFNTTYSENIEVSNIYGNSYLDFTFSSDTVVNGHFTFNGCFKTIFISGGSGAVVTNSGDSLVFNNCRNVVVNDLNIATTRIDWEKGINANGVNSLHLNNVDFSNAYGGLQLYGSHASMNNCVGSNMSYSYICDDGSSLAIQGTRPEGETLCRGASTYWDWGTVTASPSRYNEPPFRDVIIERTFTGSNYYSSRSYTEQGVFNQGSWGSQYGDWKGFVTFGQEAVNFIKDSKAIHSVQIQLTRKNSSHGVSSGANPNIEGRERLGNLNRGETKWFSMPSWWIDELRNGKTETFFYTNNSQDYILYENNAVLKINVTKSIQQN